MPLNAFPCDLLPLLTRSLSRSHLRRPASVAFITPFPHPSWYQGRKARMDVEYGRETVQRSVLAGWGAAIEIKPGAGLMVVDFIQRIGNGAAIQRTPRSAKLTDKVVV